MVSEENRAISLVRDGKMMRNLEASALRDALKRYLSPKGTREVEDQEGDDG